MTQTLPADARRSPRLPRACGDRCAGRACGRQAGTGSRTARRPPTYMTACPSEEVGRPTAAFFDLDKTIIARSSSLAFSKPFQAGGLISRRAMLRSAYAQFVYLVGGADHDQMEKMRQFMSQLTAGWDVATVREIVAETLHHIVDPIVYDEAVSLIEEHRAAGPRRRRSCPPAAPRWSGRSARCSAPTT